MDAKYDFEIGNDRDVFKLNNAQPIDFTNFEVIYDKKGINLFKHGSFTNMN